MSRNDTPSNTIVVLPPSPTFRHVTAAKPNRLTAKVYFANGMEGSSSSGYSLSQSTFPENHNGYGEGKDNGDYSGGGTLTSDGELSSDENNPNNGDDSGNGNSNGDNAARGLTRNTRASDGQPAKTLRSDEQTHHRQPLRFGLSLRYRLSDRWSLESGVIMTFHASELSAVTTTPEQPSQLLESWHADQNLTYIGIPLHANYLLWGNHRFSVYTTAGGSVEKMIHGRQHVETYHANQLQERYERNVSIRSLQLSLDGGVGAEFRFADRFSLFAEPVVSYFFDNGSAVSTIYQDQPLSFNLNVGLRLSLH